LKISSWGPVACKAHMLGPESALCLNLSLIVRLDLARTKPVH
jgi:hypothetical protein